MNILYIIVELRDDRHPSIVCAVDQSFFAYYQIEMSYPLECEMDVVDNGEAEQLAHAHHDDSHDAAEIITNMRAEGSGGTELCPTTDSAAHRRLVMEVHEAMTPANCRRENRSLATRMKNLYESCRLIMWLYGINNGESVETRQ